MPVPVDIVDAEETLQQKRARLRSLLEKGAATTSVPPVEPRGERAELEPLSLAQEALWFVSQLEGPNAAYNNSFIARFSGKLDVAALSGAVSAVVKRHDTLRTRFVVRGGVPSQTLDDAADTELVPEQVLAADAAAIYRAEARRPFDIATDRLFRATLFQESDDRFALVVTLHHIISDAWSVALFLRELMSHYTGRALAPLPVTYVDYAHWQRAWLDSGVLERQLDYWRGQLKDLPSPFLLPADHPRGAAQSSRGGTVEFAAPPELMERLIALSNEHRCSLFVYVPPTL